MFASKGFTSEVARKGRRRRRVNLALKKIAHGIGPEVEDSLNIRLNKRAVRQSSDDSEWERVGHPIAYSGAPSFLDEVVLVVPKAIWP